MYPSAEMPTRRSFLLRKNIPKREIPMEIPAFLFISKQNVLFENAKPELHVT